MEIFQTRFQLIRPYEFDDRVHTQLTFEFDLTLYRVDRKVYSILDWVGDIGGLNEGVYVGISVLLMFLQFHRFDHFLIERLYRKPKQKNGSSLDMNDSKTVWCRQRFLPCKLSREERFFAAARN